MRSTHTRWAMFSPLLADQVIDISDIPQSTRSNKHIWRISRLVYPKTLLASCILLSWLKIYLIDISLSISLKMSSDKLYSDAVRSGSSDEDVASPGPDQGNGIFDWLHVYQHESEEVALQKSLQLSKVSFITF
jgi:hypothetical protein